jgi:hypothetical protein
MAMSETPRRKNKQTERAERANVRFPLWRKKVDNSIFRDLGTTVPNWACRIWQFDAVFPGILKTNDAASTVAISFEGQTYAGRVVSTHPEGRANKVYRFYFDDALLRRLKEVFLMSHMRDLESRLRKDTTDIEIQIPFWEFLDIEFDAQQKVFHLTAHYKRTPTFPELFKNLIGSPPIKRLEDEITHPGQFRIQKQDWRPRSMYEMELGAENVIYMLLDEKAKLLYDSPYCQTLRRIPGFPAAERLSRLLCRACRASHPSECRALWRQPLLRRMPGHREPRELSSANPGDRGYVTGRSRRDYPGKIHVLAAGWEAARDCLDHVLIFGEEHLRRILNLYSLSVTMKTRNKS